MFRSTSKYVVVGVVVSAVAGVGSYYYFTRATIEQVAPLGAGAPPAGAPSPPRHEDLEREILNGIGSIKNLQPVPQQSSVRR